METESHLLNFTFSNAKSIHPNVLERVHNDDQEGIWLALNQIQYNSLQRGRDLNRRKGTPSNQIHESKIKLSMEEKLAINCEYLKGYAKYIRPTVLMDALKGDDKAMSLALGQVHHHTLPNREGTNIPKGNFNFKQSFKEILMQPQIPAHSEGNLVSATKSRSKISTNPRTKERPVVFFTGFDLGTHSRDLWVLFKSLDG